MVCTCSRVHRSRDDVRTTQTCAQPGRSQLRKITFLSRVGPEHGSRQVLASAENRPRRIGCVLGSRAPSRTCIVRRCVMKICPSQALTSSGCTARNRKSRKAYLTGSWVRRRPGGTWSKARCKKKLPRVFHRVATGKRCRCTTPARNTTLLPQCRGHPNRVGSRCSSASELQRHPPTATPDPICTRIPH